MTGLGPTVATRVLVATRPVDFRKGMDGLAALVTAELGGQPYSGVVYVFRAKKADRIKLIWWDGTGLCLMAKRLENGRFSWTAMPATARSAAATMWHWRSAGATCAASSLS